MRLRDLLQAKSFTLLYNHSIMKRLLLHDISSFHFEGILGNLTDDITPIAATPPVHHCTGCFACWVNTPGRCIIEDRAQDFAPKLMEADELIVISRLYLGGLSPDIKAFMDRMIPSMLPFFDIEDDRMRHPRRGRKKIRLTYYFYKDAANAPKSALITGERDDRNLIEVAEDYLPLDGLLIDAYGNGNAINDNPLLESAINEHSKEIDSVQAPSEQEFSVMRRLAEANARNFRTSDVEVTFIGDLLALKEIRL
jgi:multimeric flavodoxin WrbA